MFFFRIGRFITPVGVKKQVKIIPIGNARNPTGIWYVRMEGYEKEPVPEFQCPAKCDRRNDQVGDAREERVIGMGRVESMGGNKTK